MCIIYQLYIEFPGESELNNVTCEDSLQNNFDRI